MAKQKLCKGGKGTKSRAYLDGLNDRRRKRYAEDKEYRQHVCTLSRGSARKRADNHLPQERKVRACLEGLEILEEWSSRRKLVGEGRTRVVVTSFELSTLLGLNSRVMLYRWHREGKFPRPSIPVVIGRMHTRAYSVKEAKAFVRIMLEHYKVKSYLFSKDTKTILALHKVMA